MALSIKAAAYIVTIALIGTIFLAAVDIHQEPTTTTAYDHVSDLTPLVTAGEVTGYSDYNPTTNVTGWSNVTWNTTSNATMYVIKAGAANYTLHDTPKMSELGGVTIPAMTLKYPSVAASTIYNHVTLSDDRDLATTDKSSYAGDLYGVTVSKDKVTDKYFSARNVFYALNNVTAGEYESGTVYFRDLSSVAKALDWESNVVIDISSQHIKSFARAPSLDVSYDSTPNTTMTYTDQYGNTATVKGGNMSVNLNIQQEVILTHTTYTYDPTTNAFFPVIGNDTNGYPIISTASEKLYWITTNANETLSYNTYEMVTPQYAHYYDFVNIAEGATAYWNNGYENGYVQFVTTPGAVFQTVFGILSAPSTMASYPYILVTVDMENKTAYCQGIVKNWNGDTPDLSRLNVMDYVAPMKIDDPPEKTITLTGAIENYRVVYTPSNIDCYLQQEITIELGHVQGLPWVTPPRITIQENVGTFDVPSPYTYEDGVLTITPFRNITVLTSYQTPPYTNGSFTITATFNPYPQDILPSTIAVTNTTKAMVLNTSIPTDPLGQLWQDPVIDVERYFPAVFDDGARIVVSGYTVAGDSLTVNGQTFAVKDGNIEYEEKQYTIKGLAIDYKDGHTYLVFTQNNNKTVDLGETTDTAVLFGGVWYFSSDIDKITSRATTTTAVTIGQGAIDTNAVIFVFIGLLIVGALIGSYFVRGGISPMDWLIILVAGAFAIVLVS